MSATIVTFPEGAVTGEATVVQVAGDVVVLDATPFHPVDHTWPDQPGDDGLLHAGGENARVVEAVMAATDASGSLFVGEDIPVKRGTEGWTWLVGHRLDRPAPAWLAPAAVVHAEVDAVRRGGLSRGHTACHLASLALDLALADLWRKDPGPDALGNPDFEGRANQTSRIHEDGAVDEYRLGKSLRKAGFDTEGFAATLADRQQRINAQLAAWVAAGSASRVVTDGPTIIDRRRWECDLPEGTASIPCGGTHVHALSEFAAITVELDLPDPQLLVMTTTATPR
ncbi:hypothetical protein [Microbacterium luticocti]|uniref:hypothetical protein n=1 Tax=Microbacterium luticocti TaxID=451764 RepID=UPI0004090B15|nr:hypothetical protein [Microbacterium luticocti]